MKNILVVTGSARKQRATDGILESVKAELAKRDDINVTVADVRELDLPLFDHPISPKAEGYEITNESVKAWRDMVVNADGILMLTPEYNAGLSGAQKNAIDWLGVEWKDKPVASIGYGWSGAASALRHLSDVLERLEAKEVKTDKALNFMQTIDLSGAPVDGDAVASTIHETVEALEAAI